MTIEVKDITFTYPNTATPVLRAFSCCFQTGEAIAVTGQNGCGKTTLCKLLVGILRQQQGSVFIDGANTDKWSLYEMGQKIGYIWQNPSRQLFCSSVKEEVAFGLRLQGLSPTDIEKQTLDLLEQFRLSGIQDSSPLRLSMGEKQRLALATVFSRSVPYLVLDEPTGGLDIRSRRQLGILLQTLVQEKNCGIILISHERDFIRHWADRELVLS